MAAATRNEAMAFAICKYLSYDDSKIPAKKSIEESDIATLFSTVLKSADAESSLQNESEVNKWVDFASKFPANDDSHSAFGLLNEELSQKSVLTNNGLSPSVADIVVFSAVHAFASHLGDADLQKYMHAMRWMDYIQNIIDFGGLLQTIDIKKPTFEPPMHHKGNNKVEADAGPKKLTSGSSSAKNSEGGSDLKKSAAKVLGPERGEKSELNSKKSESESAKKNDMKNTAEESKKSEGKKKALEEPSDKDGECSVSILNIQVGLIQKAWKHPSADSLLVEEINLGDGVRQVVSGLAKYYSPDDLVNRRVVLITNVKPGKLRDVMSSGLVLCASNEDHTVVEPLIPPEGAKIGERISFSGYDGKPEDVLNPKKKQLDKITPHLFTDGNGMATFKGVPFMTSAGPCTSSVPKASIK